MKSAPYLHDLKKPFPEGKVPVQQRLLAELRPREVLVGKVSEVIGSGNKKNPPNLKINFYIKRNEKFDFSLIEKATRTKAFNFDRQAS